MGIIDLWLELPKGFKYGLSFFILLLSAIALLCGWFVPWGWGMGFVLLMATVVVG